MHSLTLPRPQSLSKGGEGNENIFFVGRAHHALPGNDITATDLYRLQLHCTVPNEGPSEEAELNTQVQYRTGTFAQYK